MSKAFRSWSVCSERRFFWVSLRKSSPPNYFITWITRLGNLWSDHLISWNSLKSRETSFWLAFYAILLSLIPNTILYVWFCLILPAYSGYYCPSARELGRLDLGLKVAWPTVFSGALSRESEESESEARVLLVCWCCRRCRSALNLLTNEDWREPPNFCIFRSSYSSLSPISYFSIPKVFLFRPIACAMQQMSLL